MADDNPFTVFYCWQSDLDNATNRSFIQKALESAIKELNQDDSVNLEVEIDRDTLNVPGAPDINTAILSKIDHSHAFVADVSIINQDVPKGRPAPNPNVLLEFGYALRSRGDARIVLVLNTAFGGPELLPFDLSHRRVLSYNSPDDASERTPERKELSRALLKAIRSIMENNPRFPADPDDPELSDEALQILKNAAESKDGFMAVLLQMGGTVHIQTGNLSLNFENRRDCYEWLDAVDSLVNLNFFECRGRDQNIYFLTPAGAKYWAKLSRGQG